MRQIAENKENKLPDVITVRFRFKGLPYVVCTDLGKVFQVGYVTRNHHYLSAREIPLKLHKNAPYYRISGKRWSREKLNKLAYKHHEIIRLRYSAPKSPF